MRVLSSHPVLAVHDLAGEASWYADVLGSTNREVDPGNWVFCSVGEVEIMLGRCPEAQSARDIGDHSYVAYLRVEGVDAFHARAVAAGAQIRKPPTDEPWGMREMALETPGGHRFMLGQRIG